MTLSIRMRNLIALGFTHTELGDPVDLPSCKRIMSFIDPDAGRSAGIRILDGRRITSSTFPGVIHRFIGAPSMSDLAQ